MQNDNELTSVQEALTRLDSSYYALWVKHKDNGKGYVSGNVCTEDVVAVVEYARAALHRPHVPDISVLRRMHVRAGGNVYAVNVGPRPGMSRFTGLVLNAVDEVERIYGMRGGFVTYADPNVKAIGDE